jgi:hypothetical protein
LPTTPTLLSAALSAGSSGDRFKTTQNRLPPTQNGEAITFFEFLVRKMQEFLNFPQKQKKA